MPICALLQRTGKTELFHTARGGFLGWRLRFPIPYEFGEGSGFQGESHAERCLRGVRTNFNFVQTFTVTDAHEQR
jgi:hypothetical protein